MPGVIPGIDLNFFKDYGIVGILLWLSILGILYLYRDNRSLSKQKDEIQEKRVAEAENTTSHVTMVLQEVDSDLKNLMISLITNKDEKKSS